MNDLGDIVAALRDLRAVQQSLRGLTDSRPDGWRIEPVRTRRMLAKQVTNAATLLSAYGTHPHLADAAKTMGDDLGALRGALARHQTLWPAVSLDPGSADYVVSAAGVRAAGERLGKALAAPRHCPKQHKLTRSKQA